MATDTETKKQIADLFGIRKSEITPDHLAIGKKLLELISEGKTTEKDAKTQWDAIIENFRKMAEKQKQQAQLSTPFTGGKPQTQPQASPTLGITPKTPQLPTMQPFEKPDEAVVQQELATLLGKDKKPVLTPEQERRAREFSHVPPEPPKYQMPFGTGEMPDGTPTLEWRGFKPKPKPATPPPPPPKPGQVTLGEDLDRGYQTPYAPKIPDPDEDVGGITLPPSRRPVPELPKDIEVPPVTLDKRQPQMGIDFISKSLFTPETATGKPRTTDDAITAAMSDYMKYINDQASAEQAQADYIKSRLPDLAPAVAPQVAERYGDLAETVLGGRPGEEGFGSKYPTGRQYQRGFDAGLAGFALPTSMQPIATGVKAMSDARKYRYDQTFEDTKQRIDDLMRYGKDYTDYVGSDYDRKRNEITDKTAYEKLSAAALHPSLPSATRAAGAQFQQEDDTKRYGYDTQIEAARIRTEGQQDTWYDNQINMKYDQLKNLDAPLGTFQNDPDAFDKATDAEKNAYWQARQDAQQLLQDIQDLREAKRRVEARRYGMQ